MHPEHFAAKRTARRVEEVSATDFFVRLGCEPRDDQIALFIEQEKSVAVLDDENLSGAGSFRSMGLERFPDALAGVGSDAAEHAAAVVASVDAVDVPVLKKRRAENAVEGGLFLDVAIPHHL